MKTTIATRKDILVILTIGFCLWGTSADATAETAEEYYGNPLSLGGDGTDTLADFVIVAIKFLLSLVGIFALLFLIIGGIRYITAAGSEEAMQSAKHTVTSAITGLALSLLAYGIVLGFEQILQMQS
jgi:hypothetical protein